MREQNNTSARNQTRDRLRRSLVLFVSLRVPVGFQSPHIGPQAGTLRDVYETNPWRGFSRALFPLAAVRQWLRSGAEVLKNTCGDRC